MSGPVDALVIVAVVGAVIARQLRPRAVSAGGRWWLVPAVMVVLAVRQGGLIDPAHKDAALALLAAEMATGAAMGVVWATTTRMWTDKDGAIWAQGTSATIAVWAAGLAIRAGLYAIGAAAGVRQDAGSVLLAVALTLLIRTGILRWRAQSGEPSYRTVS